jgi:hypothetical protein
MLPRILALVTNGEVRISEHGYDELAADGILVRDVIDGIKAAVLVEDYPEFAKGPCVLVLQRERNGNPIHVLRGVPKGESGPAVLITAYRPDPKRWSADLRRRM